MVKWRSLRHDHFHRLRDTTAADEMEADGLTVYDVEHCLLTGKVATRQRDRRTGEWKYLVEGRTLSRGRATVVTRIGATGKLVIITVYTM